MDEQRKKELEEKVKLTPEQLQTLANFKPLAEELNRLTEQQQDNVLLEQLRGWTEQASKVLEPTLKAMDAMNEANRKLYEAHRAATEPIRKLAETIAQAALETQEALIQLGVSSGRLTDAIELFTPEVQGAFMAIFRLARTHLETGLKLKDYADAIRPDLTVKDDFLFRGELEQVLQEAAEDIAEYNRTLQVEQKINSRADKLKQAKKAREKAVAMGAIMTINRHLAAPSEKELVQLFTPENVYLLKSTEQFDNEGRLQEQEGKQADIQRVDKVHTQFLMLVFRMVCLYYDPSSPDRPDEKIIFSIPRMLDELGLDARKGSAAKLDNVDDKEKRLRRILDIIEPSTDKLIRLPKGVEYYRICAVSSVDKEAEIITLDVPYFFRLIEYIAQQKYKDKAINKLFHSTIANETNTAAVELAARILAGVKQRGLHKDNKELGIGVLVSRTTKTKGKTKTVQEVYASGELTPEEQAKEPRISYSIKWETLILDCPQLTAKLNAVMSSDKTNKAALFNNVLRDTIGAAYRIIMEKSDAPQYYLDFRIEPQYTDGGIIPPTKSQLKKCMTVSHKGKNKSFEQGE